MLTIRSLRRFDREVRVYVVALSDLCATVLEQLALPNVEIIPLAALEEAYPELVAVKPTRKLIEYYFTLSPYVPHYLFAQTTPIASPILTPTFISSVHRGRCWIGG